MSKKDKKDQNVENKKALKVIEKKNKKEKKKDKEPGKIKKFFLKIGEILKKKWLINGSKTLLLVAIIVAVYIGVNILLDNVVLPEIDLTSDKLYSISDETKDKIGGIDKEIKITLINYSSDSSVTNFVEKYTTVNKNISIEKIEDLSARTDLMQKYSLESTDTLILVKCGDTEKALYETDLYTYDYSTYATIDLTEEAITNAIVNVTTEEKPKVYFMTNHIAYSSAYYSTILSSIEDEGNEVETLDILSNGSVPEDCDTLIITTLNEDITEQERDCILTYIRNGGNLLLMCGPNYTEVSLDNFQKVLDEYGISISNGVVFEQDKNKMLSGYPDIVIADVKSTPITEKLNMTLQICLVDAGKITFDEDNLSNLGVTYETIATTSDSAFERTNLNITSATKTSSDSEEQQMILGAYVVKTYSNESTEESEEETTEETEDVTSKLIIYSNELMATDVQMQISGYTINTISLYNNKDMILNSISYLNERENTITIRKSSESVTYTVTQAQHNTILSIIFITPIVIIILGIIIWIIRRRRK